MVHHLICGLLAVAFGWLAAPMGAATAAPEHLVSYCSYDAPSYDAPTTHTALERGPPVQSLDYTVVAPGHRWSPGVSARLEAGSIAAIATYAHHERTAQAARTMTTPGAHVLLTHDDSSLHGQAGVAANGADNVVNGTRLGQQLAGESAESEFTS